VRNCFPARRRGCAVVSLRLASLPKRALDLDDEISDQVSSLLHELVREDQKFVSVLVEATSMNAVAPEAYGLDDAACVSGRPRNSSPTL
jgi:hypothetical protein